MHRRTRLQSRLTEASGSLGVNSLTRLQCTTTFTHLQIAVAALRALAERKLDAGGIKRQAYLGARSRFCALLASAVFKPSTRLPSRPAQHGVRERPQREWCRRPYSPALTR